MRQICRALRDPPRPRSKNGIASSGIPSHSTAKAPNACHSATNPISPSRRASSSRSRDSRYVHSRRHQSQICRKPTPPTKKMLEEVRKYDDHIIVRRGQVHIRSAVLPHPARHSLSHHLLLIRERQHLGIVNLAVWPQPHLLCTEAGTDQAKKACILLSIIITRFPDIHGIAFPI